jgi:hypothetical protein
MSHVQAFIGGRAIQASQQLGATAYTAGKRIAFAHSPSLELAAHEAAHVVQQQSGKVQLKGGVGEVGDEHERHADAVADLVVQGKSAVSLLGEYGKPNQTTVQARYSEDVQAKCSKCETTEQSQNKSNDSQTSVNLLNNSTTLSSNGEEITNSNVAPTILAMNPGGQCIQIEDLPAWEQRLQQAKRTGGDALDQFCYELSQLIEDCHGDLHKRLEDMLNDLRTGQQLFKYRRYMKDHPEGNTWEGHQVRYENTRKITKRLIEWWYDNCGDGLDGEYFLPAIEAALIAANIPKPTEPLPENNQALLERALRLGAQLRGGALRVSKKVGKAILIVLIIIAASLRIPLYQN